MVVPVDAETNRRSRSSFAGSFARLLIIFSHSSVKFAALPSAALAAVEEEDDAKRLRSSMACIFKCILNYTLHFILISISIAYILSSVCITMSMYNDRE